MTKVIKCGVIGDPIDHSLSPTIHNYFIEKHQVNGSYDAIKVEEENLRFEINKLVKKGFKGFNVTIPHKESVFKICDKLSNTARIMGAVNTVIVMDDGKLFGHNSDAEGFLKNLENTHPDFNLNDKIVFLVGSGGASRAIVHGLINKGVKKIFITNRDQSKVDRLINDFMAFSKEKNCELKFFDRDNFCPKLNSCDLLINSTSLGMEGFPDLDLDIKNLKKTAIIYDIIYKPLMTKLLTQGKDRGYRIVTGIGMLVYQALVGFELWYGKSANHDDILNQILIKKLEK